jgi:hypothetical protein
VTRRPLKHVIVGPDVSAGYVLLPPPGERATSPAAFRRGPGVAAATGARETRKLEAGA